MATTTDPFAPILWLYDMFTGNGGHSSLAATGQQFLYNFINFYARFAVFSLLFSLVLLGFVIMYARRYAAVRGSMIQKVVDHDVATTAEADKVFENPKWKLVQEHINSPEPANWRLAILEADIILADLLDTMHLPGDTIGDKLKAVDAGNFETIEAAWEAHKIRNAIAHEGSDFLLTEREAKRIVKLYGEVFYEFEMI